MWQVGVAKIDITPDVKGMGMMGYGMYHNKVKGVADPIFARATVFEDGRGKRFAFVNAEICFITPNLKQAVLERLQQLQAFAAWHDDSLMLTAQHTHSAPGGYSYHGFYNLSIPGFVPAVFERYAAGITQAILEATASMQPARLWYGKGTFAPDKEVAFNRSPKAFKQNAETASFAAQATHLAVDRTMSVLKITDLDMKPLALLSWFGVHTTSISNDNHLISPDNKGYASHFFEQKYKAANPAFVAIFAQAPCGDVSPNYIWDEKKKWTRGKFEDDFESAKYNGQLQYELADSIFSDDEALIEIEGKIACVQNYVDFSKVKVNPAFADGKERSTSKAVLGVTFLEGTREGPGVPKVLGILLRMVSHLIRFYELGILAPLAPKRKTTAIRLKYHTHRNKHVLIETQSRRIAGIRKLDGLVVPDAVDKTLFYIKSFYRNGAMQSTEAWTPHILPIQLVQLGQLVLVGTPAELTTVAGWRLRDTLSKLLPKDNIIINCPYANAYCGYITTPEEYDCQLYEGGHTVFGKWTLPAFQTKFQELAYALQDYSGLKSYEVEPEKFDPAVLALWRSPEV